jgi:ubiquinone/menaquinone biosynthesis C-methylase UbiE
LLFGTIGGSCTRKGQGSKEFQKHFDNKAHRYEKVAFEGSIGSRFVSIREQELVKSMYRESFSNKRKILDIGAGNG